MSLIWGHCWDFSFLVPQTLLPVQDRASFLWSSVNSGNISILPSYSSYTFFMFKFGRIFFSRRSSLMCPSPELVTIPKLQGQSITWDWFRRLKITLVCIHTWAHPTCTRPWWVRAQGFIDIIRPKANAGNEVVFDEEDKRAKEALCHKQLLQREGGRGEDIPYRPVWKERAARPGSALGWQGP